jgi:hypothetical protein
MGDRGAEVGGPGALLQAFVLTLPLGLFSGPAFGGSEAAMVAGPSGGCGALGGAEADVADGEFLAVQDDVDGVAVDDAGDDGLGTGGGWDGDRCVGGYRGGRRVLQRREVCTDPRTQAVVLDGGRGSSAIQ